MNTRYIALVLVVLSGIAASTASADNPRAPLCRIDVRSKSVGVPGFVHLFLIYVNHLGEATYFRGGPLTSVGTSGAASGSSGSGSSASGPGQGQILVRSGPYRPGSDDYGVGLPSVTALRGAAACNKNACLRAEKARINNRRVPYGTLGPNSNSVARTLLQRCGLPLKRPGDVAPGWDTVL